VAGPAHSTVIPTLKRDSSFTVGGQRRLLLLCKAVFAAEWRGTIRACADDAQTWSTSQQLQPVRVATSRTSQLDTPNFLSSTSKRRPSSPQSAPHLGSTASISVLLHERLDSGEHPPRRSRPQQPVHAATEATPTDSRFGDSDRCMSRNPAFS
jgi:hypothetical protein